MDHRANPVTNAGTLSPAWRSRRGAVASRPGWPAGLTSHAPTGGPGTGLAEVVPGRAVAQLQRPVGHDLAGVLLWRALPHVVPGLTLRESFLGRAAARLSHIENLPERLPIVAAAALIVLAALGLGELILATLRLRGKVRPAERLALDFGLGTAGLGVLTLLAGRAGLLHPWLFRAGLGVIALAGLVVSRFWRIERPRLDAPASSRRAHCTVPDHHAPGSNAARY